MSTVSRAYYRRSPIQLKPLTREHLDDLNERAHSFKFTIT